MVQLESDTEFGQNLVTYVFVLGDIAFAGHGYASEIFPLSDL